jgi:hypothetical protein
MLTLLQILGREVERVAKAVHANAVVERQSQVAGPPIVLTYQITLRRKVAAVHVTFAETVLKQPGDRDRLGELHFTLGPERVDAGHVRIVDGTDSLVPSDPERYEAARDRLTRALQALLGP